MAMQWLNIFLNFSLEALTQNYRIKQKKSLAKFSDICSVRADGLCIGYLGQWTERGRQNLNVHDFFARPCMLKIIHLVQIA